MTRLTFLSYLMVLTICFSCGKTSPEKETKSVEEASPIKEKTDKKEEVANDSNEERFETFVALYDSVQLPVAIESFQIDLEQLVAQQTETYKDIRSKSGFSDFTFYPSKILSKNAQYTALMSYELSRLSIAVPVIETYTNTGELIDLKALDYGWEESETTSIKGQSATINEDLTFSFEIRFESVDLEESEDENGNYVLNEVTGSRKNFREYNTGRIKPDGTIGIDAPEREELTE